MQLQQVFDETLMILEERLEKKREQYKFSLVRKSRETMMLSQ